MTACASVALAPGGDPDDAADAFAAGEPVLVGDSDDAVVFVAAMAARIDAARLQTIQELAAGMTVLGLGTEHAQRLGLMPLAPQAGGAVPHGRLGLELGTPIDAATGIRGGWSLRDRAHTMRTAADPDCRATDLSVPGHVHPAAVTTAATPAAAAALELARRYGSAPAVALSAVTGGDGMPVGLLAAQRTRELRRLPHVSSAHMRAEALTRRTEGRIVDCALPTRDGAFRAIALDDGPVDPTHGSAVALVHGDPAATASPVVHVHPACLLGDTFGSLLCECQAELTGAADAILAAGAGVIVYVKPGVEDPNRRYHCGRDTPVDRAPVLALLRACGVNPELGDNIIAGPRSLTRPS
jgi:3,4-dihydroxy 2-butanone 4-phosphate synthase/GTP cyclohydrolase II